MILKAEVDVSIFIDLNNLKCSSSLFSKGIKNEKDFAYR